MKNPSFLLPFLRHHLRLPVALVMLLMVPFWSLPLHGATFYWDADADAAGNNATTGSGLGNIGGPFTWDTTLTNWWNGVSVADQAWMNGGDIAVFTGTAGTVTLGAPIMAGGLIFNSSGYTLTGSTLTLAAPTGLGSPVIAVNGLNSRAKLDAILAGSSGFTKTGVGYLSLTNIANTFSGDIAIKDGALIITDAGQLGTGTTAISITGIAQSGNPGYSGGSLLLAGSTFGPGITLNREVTVSGRGPNAVNNTGGLVSMGYNTLAGGLTLGAATSDSRVWATHGTTTITGGVNIGGTGQNSFFQGNGNWTISGVVAGSDLANDRFMKAGQIVSTTLWLQNSANSFVQSVRVDSGTVRVQTSAVLGRNTGTGQIDLNNGTLEVRTDDAAGFAGRTVRLRNNVTGTIFVDHDMTGPLSIGTSAQNQTVTMGALIRDTGANNTNFTYAGRNGYNISFSSALPTAGDYRSWTLNNNTSGTVTYFGDTWNTNVTTAGTFTVGGNGDTIITGSILATGEAHVLTKSGSGTFTYGGAAGTYTGVTNINAGTLSFSNVGAFAGTASINLASAALGGALNYTGVGETLAKTINLNSTTGPAFIYANQTAATGPFVISANLTATGAGAKTLVLGGSNQLANAINGIILDNSGTNTTSVTKTGTGSWTLSGANTNTGALTINAGTLILRATAAGSVDIYKATGAVIFNADATTSLSGNLGMQSAGGTLQFNGFTGGSQEALGALTATAGQGRVAINGTNATGSSLTFASLGTRSAGAALDFLPSTGAINFTAAVPGTNGIVGGFATINGTNFVTSIGAGGSVAASSYTSGGAVFDSTPTGTGSATKNWLSSGSFAVATSFAANSLKIDSGGTFSGTTSLTITSASATSLGGILFDNTGGAGGISGFTGITTSAANQELIVYTGGSTPANGFTIASPFINGSGGLTKGGDGLLILSGTSTFTGNVNINEGTVRLSGATANIGASQAAATVFNLRQGAIFDLNGAGGGSSTIGALNGAGSIINSGASTLIIGNGATTTVANAAFTGTLQGAGLGLTKEGTGVQYLTGVNTYGGVTTINRGVLAVTSLANGGLASSIGQSGSAATNLVFNNGGTLRYTGSDAVIAISTQTPSITTDRQFTLAGNGTIQSSGTYGNSFLTTGAANSASLIFSSTADISFSGVTGGRLFTLGGTSVGDNEMRIRLIDNDSPSVGFNVLSLTKADAGLWILNPLTSNTYTGETIISGGALRALTAGPVLGLSAASLLTLNGGVLETSGTFTRTLGAAVGNVRITGGASGFAAATSDRLVVTLGGGDLTWGSTNFNPSSLVLGSSTALGETQLTNNINLGTTGRTVTVNNNGNTGVMVTAGILSGVISGGAGGTLTKNGGGVLMLGDANTYIGNTILNNGSLLVTSIGNVTGTTASSLGASGGSLVFNSGTNTVNLLYVGSGETASRPISITSGASTQRIDSSGTGALVLNGSFTNSATGAVTLELRGSNTEWNQLAPTTAITNGGANVLTITKTDGGLWILNPSVASSFTGNININGGTLGLTANAIGTGGGTISISNGALMAFDAPLAISNTISHANNAAVVFSGSNSITLNGGYSLVAGNNAMTISNNLDSGAILTVNGLLTNLKTNDQTLNIRGFGSTVWNGVIQNAASNTTALAIAIADNATFTFGGASANTYTGATTLGQGTLILNKNSGVAQFGASSVFNFNGGVLQGGAIDLTGVNKIMTPVVLAGDQATVSGSRNIEFGATTALLNSGASRFLLNNLDSGKTLTISGNVSLTNDTNARTLTIRGSGVTEITGIVQNGGAGAGSLAFSGLGSLNLTSNATATGALTVNRNLVILSGANGSWNAGTFTLNPTGILRLDNTATNNALGRLSNTGTFSGNGGTLDIIGNAGGSTHSAGALTLNNVQTYITMSGGAVDLTFASVNFANPGSALNLNGVSNLGTTNKVKFTAAPTMIGGLLPRVFVGGNDFATYHVTDGVKVFASYNDSNNLNTAASGDTMNVTTNAALTADKTLNALKINGTGLSVSGASRALTLSAAGILNTGGDNSLDVSRVNFGALPGFFQIQNGTTLMVTSGMVGTGGLSKGLTGSLVLQKANFITGTTTVLNGTMKLDGGLNTLFPNQQLFINNGATLDLNGNAQYTERLNDPGTLPDTGGTITSLSGTGLYVTNMGGATTVATAITGAVNFARVGNNTLAFESAQTYTGSTTLMANITTLQDDATLLGTSVIHLNGGQLFLNNNASLQTNINNRVGDGIAIFMRDGTLTYTGKIADASTETLGAITSRQGANTIAANTGGIGQGQIASADLFLTSLTRDAGTTINFTGTNLGQQGNSARIYIGGTVTTTATGALGAWAIANSTDFAAFNSGTGIGVVGQGGFTGYDGTFASGNITEIFALSTTTTTLAAGNTTTGMLRIAGGFTHDLAFTNAADILNLELGGLLRSNNNNATTIGTTGVRGVLTAGGTEVGGTRELVVYNNQNTVTINSVIADNGFGNSVNLLKSGAGTLVLTANNTYTGGTNVVQGTVTLNGNGIVVPAGGIILGGATMTMLVTSGQIDASNSVTLRRGSTLTLFGSNTLDSLIFENTGGTSTPTVTIPTGGTLTLTNSNAIKASSANAATTATVTGGTLALAAGVNIFDIDGIKVDGTIYTKIQPTLNIGSVITGAGSSVTKTGDGILQLSGQSTFNGLNVTGGGILISGNSTPTTGGAGIGSGPLGIGSVSMASGTTMLVDGSRSIGNNVSFADTPTFDSTANTAWTLTLNGTIGGAGWSANPTVQINNPFLTVALLGDLGALTGITKTGLGILTFNSTNYTGDFDAAALGNPNSISLLNDGDGRAAVGTVNTGNVIFDTGVVGTIIVGRAGGTALFPLAANKILAPASISNVGLGLTVTNNNGYGLRVSESFVLTATPTFSVATATSSTLTQGLYLVGDLSGTGFNKTGAGTLVIDNSTPANNTFTGNIYINQGVLSVATNGQLGNAANMIVLSPTTGTSAFRATGTFATSRVIQLANTTSTRAIEVSHGNTLTLNSAFDLNGGAGATASLNKQEGGTLIVNASNSGWSGSINIVQGTILVNNSALTNPLGTGTIFISQTAGVVGAALQLAGGVTINNDLNLQNTANILNGGINFQGMLDNVSGINTYAGGIAMPWDSTIGARAGSTLNITGLITATGTHRLQFNAEGDINWSGGETGALFGFDKYGSGTLNISAPIQGAISGTGGVQVHRGVLVLSGNATTNSSGAVNLVYGGATLRLNNSGTNTNNRLTGRAVTLRGGTFDFIANNSTETAGAFVSDQGANTINIGGSGTAALTFSGITMIEGSSLNVTGTYGTATKFLKFTTNPALTPASTGILNRVTVDGNELASYSASLGVVAFTGYSPATNILSVAATQTFKATTSTLNSLTSNQTINALTINNTAAVGGLGGLAPAALTLSSGTILANGTGGAFLNVPIVALSGEGIIHVQSGQSLTINSGMTGTAGLSKSLAGDLNINAPQFVSGTHYINAGTLKLTTAAATNTLLFNQAMAVNAGGTVDLNGNHQFIAGLSSASAGGSSGNGGGTVTNSAVGQSTFTVNGNTNFGGVISGNIYLNKTGTGALNLQQAQTYTGATLLTGGTMTLNDNGALPGTSQPIDIYFATLSLANGNLYDVADRVSDTAAITLKGGNITITGRQQSASSETLGSITLADAFNVISLTTGGTNVNSLDVTAASLTRTGDTATIRFRAFGQLGNSERLVFTAAPTLTNNIIGAWAIVDREYASYDSVMGIGALNGVGYAGYAGNSLNSNPLATDNIRFTSTGTTLLAANTTVNTLTFAQQATATILDLGGNTLTLQGGGLLLSQGTDNIDFSITNGTLTSGLLNIASDFYITHANFGGTNRTVTLNSAVANNGTGAVRLVFTSGQVEAAGVGNTTLNAVNTNTGGTIINSGNIVLGATGALGTGGITINQGSLTQLLGGMLPSTNALTMGGASTLTLANQANTLAGITFNNMGGAAPTVTPTGTLTLTSGITVNTMNAGAVATIGAGTLDLNGAGAFAMNVGATVVNGVDVAPWQAGLNITSLIQNGGITKTGAGLLQLSNGLSTFAGGINVTSGGLVIGASSTGPISGPLGAGTVTMAANTTLVSTGNFSVNNDFVFLGDTVFNGTQNLTLNGLTTLPSVWNATVTAPQMTVTISDASGSLATDVVNKSGLGTLNIGSYNGTINAAGGLVFLADGNTVATVESVALGSTINLTADTAITVNRSGAAPNARNKTIQQNELTNNGSILAVSNLSGYGLEFTGATSLTGASHFSVGIASASNLIQGLTLSGVVSDTGGFDLVKSGVGTLVLTNSGNTFGGVGKTIDILNGVLAANSDGALGNASNSITLGVDGTTGTGFRATGSFSTGREFRLNALNNAFEVTQGNILTLTSAFTLGAAANALIKNDNGVLVLNANNTGWTGAITINGGAIRIGNASALGSGAITINSAVGSALELTSGITYAGAITLVTNGGSGFNSGGVIQSFSGVNTLSGLITQTAGSAFTYGAAAGATLNITGGIAASNSATFFAGAGGVVNLQSAYGNGGAGGPSFIKNGAGTLNVTSSQSAVTSAITVTGGVMNLSGSNVRFGTAATAAVTIAAGSTLAVSDVGTATSNRLGGRTMTLQGGTFSYLGNAGTSTETLAALTTARGNNTIISDSNGGTSTITFASLGSSTVAVAADGSLNFVSGTAALGTASNRIMFTTGPTLTNSIIQRATVNGSDFATWTAGSGIAAFTAYGTDINSATTTGTLNLTTSVNLTANRTHNAIKLNSASNITLGATGAAFLAGGTTPAQLTLSAGGILATGGGSHTISAPVINFSTVQGFYAVDTGTALNISSTVIGSAGWVKTGGGTLTFTPPSSSITGRGASTITGNGNINNGTVILNGGNNTLVANAFLNVAAGGTLDLNGNAQLVRSLFTDGGFEGAGGIVTGSAASSTLVMNNDNTGRSWSGQLTGALSFMRTGDNTMTFYSDNTYTGSTFISGGTTTLRDGARLSGTSGIEIVYATLNIDNAGGLGDLADRIKDSATISLRGGTLAFLGRAQTASTETVGAVTLNRGLSFITSAAGGTGINSAELTLASLAQAANSAATINFNTANLGQIGSFGRIIIINLNGNANANTTLGAGLTNNIIGGWALVQNDFATYIPGLGVAALGAPGALQYDLVNSFIGAQPTHNVRLTSSSAVTLGGVTVNALSMTGSNIALNFLAGGDILNLVSGGLIGPNNNQTIGTTAIRGVLTAGGSASSGTSSLYLYNRANTLTVNSQIVDTSTAIGSGSGNVQLVLSATGGTITLGNGTNSHTGGTVVNGGTVNLNATTGGIVIPGALDPTQGLIINGATVTMQNMAGQIAASNIVTINGSSTLNLFGSNTLAGLIFRDDGGGSTASQVVANLPGALLILEGNIVSTTANPASTSTIVGRVDFGTTQRTLDISATNFNGQELAALLSDFNLQGVVGSSGGIVKTGDGVLQFNGISIYTGTTTVNGGRIQLGVVNGGSRFSTYDLNGAATGLNLNGQATGILGGLSGSGYVTNSGAASTLSVGYNGANTTFSGTFLRFNDAVPAAVNLVKIGTGTLTFDASGAASTTTGSLSVNRGAVTFKDNGTNSFRFTALIVNEGGTLNLDNSSANINNRLAGGALTLNGGTLNMLGRDATATTELAGVLTLGPSASLINLTPGITGGTVTLTFASLTQSAGSTAIVSGTNLGTDSKILFTTAPTLSPATTGILARIAVGNDFATYNATNGIIAFNGYVTPTDINTAAATATIKIDATTTLRALNLARTIGAVNIIDDNVVISSNGTLLRTQGWTVTSGGVLVNGNNASITTPVLAFGGAEGIFRINGSSLNVSSSITGTAGITKTGSGSMTLSTLQSYTGQTALNLGNLTLAGGKNTLLVTPTATIPGVADLQVNGGVLDLNGNDQAVRTLLNSNTLSFIAGEITNSSGTAVTLTTAMNANSIFGAKITGNLGLTRSGNNTLTLPDAHTYTGATIIRGGGLTLQDLGSLTTSSISLYFGALTLNNANLNPMAALNPVRFAASTPVTMQGASWTITPGGVVDNTTSLDTLTILAGGANTITAGLANGATNTVTIGNLILPINNGTTLHFAGDIGQMTTGGAQVFLNQINGVSPVNNAFLGVNFIINSGEYGVYNTQQGIIRFGGTAISGNTVPAYAAALASGNNLPTNISSTGADVVISADTTIGALRLTGAATRNITFTAGTEKLNLALGGLLRDNNNNATSIGTAALRGILISGGTANSGTTDLVVWGNQNTITINSVIANNGLGNLTRLVKSGATTLTLTAQNTYTGGTIVNQGTLNLSGTNVGFVVIPTGGLTINDATVTMNTNAGQIDSSNDVFLNAGALLTLFGSNTLNSVTFNNTGGRNQTPTVNSATLLTLTSATPITSTNDSYSFTPTISGTEILLADGATITTSGLSPIDLIISAKISTSGSTTAITKTGTGSLVLSSTTSAFTNGFNLAQGSLIFGAGSTGTPPAVTAGPIGTGTLSLANGVAIMSDGTARTIGNAVSVAGDFTFGTRATDDARANAGNSLTLSGVVTLAAGPHTIEVGGLLMVGTISGRLTGGMNLIKTGLGTLVLSSTANDFGGTTTISDGTLQLGAAGVLPDGSALTIAAAGALNINGLNETIGSLAGAGLVTNSGAAATLTTGADNTDTTFSGVIANGTNALNFLKLGAGIQTLSGANFYTGTTTVNAGILSVANNLALGTTAAGTTVASGASLELQGGITITGEALSITGAGSASSGALRNLSGDNTYAGTITLTGAATIQSDSGTLTLDVATGNAITATAQNVTFTGAGNISVADAIATTSGSVTKTGTGTLILSGANTYTGGTAINGGVLQVNSSGALGTTGTISFEGGTLQYTANNTTDYSNRISTAANQAVSIDSNGQNVTFATALTSTGGSLTKSGTGTLVLTAANSYSGTTSVTGGTLQIGDGMSGSLTGSGTVTVSGSGTVLSGSGSISGSTIIGSGAILAPGVGDTNASNHTLTFTAGLSVENGGQVQLSITDRTEQLATADLNALTAALSGGTYTSVANLFTSGELDAYKTTAAGNHDLVSISGSFSVDADGTTPLFKIVNRTGAPYTTSPVIGDVFNLMDWAGVMNFTGSNTSLSAANFDFSGAIFSGDFAFDTSAFATHGILVVVPEPSRVLFLMLGLLGLMLRRRRMA